MDDKSYKALPPREKYLLNLEQADRDGTPRLVLASTFNDVEMVRSLISEGTDVNAARLGGRRTALGGIGQTALMVASRYGFAEIVQILLDASAQIENQDERGVTALLLAAENGHGRIVRLLLARGANPKFVTIHGRTFLHAAVAGGDFDLVKLALEYPHQINAQSEDGTTPLLLAASNRRAEIVQKLIEQGADVNLPDRDGTTPLIAAAPDDDYPGVVGTVLFSLLIKHGANVNAEENDGLTALMRASFYGDLEAVKLLVSAGAEISHVDGKGRNALSLALAANHFDIANFLRGQERTN